MAGRTDARAQPPAAEPNFGIVEQWHAGVRPRPKVLYLNLIVLVILALWAGSMWVAPYTVPHASVHLSPTGVVGLIDNEAAWENMTPFARWIYHAGDQQCHQRPARTLFLNGNPMPFCARCVAIYTLMAVGVAITVFPRLPKYDSITEVRWWVIVLALAPIGVDGVGQLLGFWESTNIMRFLTGGLIGLVTGMALGYMLREVGPGIADARRDLRQWRWERRAMRSGPPQPPPSPSQPPQSPSSPPPPPATPEGKGPD